MRIANTAIHRLGELNEPDKWWLLSESAVFALCSDSESFGMSVVEAMAAGMPVVVTHTCPWQEVETVGCGMWVHNTTTLSPLPYTGYSPIRLKRGRWGPWQRPRPCPLCMGADRPDNVDLLCIR